jgi:hypothetical protein
MNDTDRVAGREVQTAVFAVIPEFHLVKVRAEDGFEYSLTRATPGVDLSTLRPGDQVRCVVSRRLPRVISARKTD